MPVTERPGHGPPTAVRQVRLPPGIGLSRKGDVVMQDYETFLGRTHSAAEVTGWVNAFESSAATNEDVIAGFVGSGEFFKDIGSSPGNWWRQAVIQLFESGAF
jgi:hypothetical protein